jgi:hypothetical protein
VSSQLFIETVNDGWINVDRVVRLSYDSQGRAWAIWALAGSISTNTSEVKLRSDGRCTIEPIKSLQVGWKA